MKSGRKLFAFMLAALFCFSGCSKTEEAVKTIPTELAKLPDTIKLTAKIPLEYPKSLPYYAVKSYEGDVKKAQEALMKNEPNKEGKSAQGEFEFMDAAYLEKDSLIELVRVSVGENSLGRFHYSLETPAFLESDPDCLEYGPNDIEYYLTPNKPYRSMGNVFTQNPEYSLMKEFPAEKDLDFLPYADAKAQIEAAMEKSGLPELELYLTESFTTEIMQYNRDLYNEARVKEDEENNVPEESRHKLFGELGPEKEFYYFVYRQAQDGVPFANSVWWVNTAGIIGNETSVTVAVGRDGLLHLSGHDLFDVGEKLEEKTLLSPEQALNVYLEEYNRSIHFEEQAIFSIELNYVVVSDETKRVARPVWMIGTSEKLPPPKSDPTMETCTLYRYHAISADTGVILERGTDMR